MSRFYLARQTGTRDLELVDGAHDEPSGVEKAARVFKRVYDDDGPWIMIAITDVPSFERGLDDVNTFYEQLLK